jgi:hypothetical protein
MKYLALIVTTLLIAGCASTSKTGRHDGRHDGFSGYTTPSYMDNMDPRYNHAMRDGG